MAETTRIRRLVAAWQEAVDRLEEMADDDAGDPHVPAWWDEVARRAEAIASASRAVAVTLNIEHQAADERG